MGWLTLKAASSAALADHSCPTVWASLKIPWPEPLFVAAGESGPLSRRRLAALSPS